MDLLNNRFLFDHGFVGGYLRALRISVFCFDDLCWCVVSARLNIVVFNRLSFQTTRLYTHGVFGGFSLCRSFGAFSCGSRGMLEYREWWVVSERTWCHVVANCLGFA